MPLPNDYAAEANHLNLQINAEQIGDQIFTIVGHVSGVDPTTNRIKVVLPTWSNDNQTFVETGWISLGAAAAGNEYGIQILPFGGASPTDLTGQATQQPNGTTPSPEQVLVHILSKQRGLYVTGIQMFNQQYPPPTGYQDKSGVQAAAGEWLFKHASGSYLYMDNKNNITLESFTNPAPVLQPTDAPASVTQALNLTVRASGTNTNQNGDKPAAVNSNLNVTNTATDGQVNNPTSTETITSYTQGIASKIVNLTADSSQGTGQYRITINSNNSSMTIDIKGNTNEYNLNVVNGTVNVVSETSNIKSNSVNLGTGTMQRILNDVFAQFFNNHVHTGVLTGTDTSGPPSVLATSDQESQNAYSS